MQRVDGMKRCAGRSKTFKVCGMVGEIGSKWLKTDPAQADRAVVYPTCTPSMARIRASQYSWKSTTFQLPTVKKLHLSSPLSAWLSATNFALAARSRLKAFNGQTTCFYVGYSHANGFSAEKLLYSSLLAKATCHVITWSNLRTSCHGPGSGRVVEYMPLSRYSLNHLSQDMHEDQYTHSLARATLQIALLHMLVLQASPWTCGGRRWQAMWSTTFSNLPNTKTPTTRAIRLVNKPYLAAHAQVSPRGMRH